MVKRDRWMLDWAAKWTVKKSEPQPANAYDDDKCTHPHKLYKKWTK